MSRNGAAVAAAAKQARKLAVLSPVLRRSVTKSSVKVPATRAHFHKTSASRPKARTQSS